MFILPEHELERADRVLQQRVAPYVDRVVSHCEIEVVEYPGEPLDSRIVLGQIKEGRVEFSKKAIPLPWGSVWGTAWFRLSGKVPSEYRDEQQRTGSCDLLELQVNLGWLPERGPGFQSEGMVYREDGTAIKSVNPRNHWVPLVDADGFANVPLRTDGTFTVFIEAAANPFVEGPTPFSPTKLGERPEMPTAPIYTFSQADVCVHDSNLFAYQRELTVVAQLIRELHEEQPRYWQMLKALQRSLNVYDERDRSTVAGARAELSGILKEPAEASVLRHIGVGHAHIDSAWLWPVRETRRKVARTVSNVLALMDQDPDFTYAMSSAQQYAWLEEDHPDLFKRMLERIEEGRFIPVGGMWVESDNMMPCGESLVRQITYGKRYFKNHLGVEPRGVWLPDSFGYTGAWPQIARRAGFEWFLTQKISWNDTTKFPHHSFEWEGIDGTSILTHFPPSDTYCAAMDAHDLIHSQANYLDKDISRNAIILYGWGDGGGGPTREMTANLRLMHDLDGVPRVEFGTPDELFRRVGEDVRNAGKGEIPTFHGELYLELHRGTLTSQQDMKRGCRREEALLRVTEYLCALAALADPDYVVPQNELDQIWHTLLLNQFHDILPGSAIEWVHRQARAEYARDMIRLREISTRASEVASRALRIPLIERAQLLQCDDGSAPAWRAVPEFANNDDLCSIETAGLWDSQTRSVKTTSTEKACEISTSENVYVLNNGCLKVTVAGDGTVISLIDLLHERELVPKGTKLGQYELLRNEPFHWDAWEIQRDALLSAHVIAHSEVISAEVDSEGNAHVHVRSEGEGALIVTTITLRCGAMYLDYDADVDWRAVEKFLKVDIPMTLMPAMAQYECQYGLVERHIAKNTRSDEAKFESCTHRFVRIADAGYAMAVANASTYGSDVMPIRNGVLVGTMVRLSLLSAPLYPDPYTDQGVHEFRWSVMADASMARTLGTAARLNAPDALSLPDCAPLVSLEQVSGYVVLDWIKLADDGSGDVVLRAYEASGSIGTVRLHCGELLIGAFIREVDVLEDELIPEDGLTHVLSEEVPADGAELRFAPFEMATLRIRRDNE